MFVSTFEATIDGKGRVMVPAPFRAVLGSNDFYLRPALDGAGCLEGCGEALMRVFQQQIDELPMLSEERKVLHHAVFARAHRLKMDDAGRVKIPDPLLSLAQIETALVFAGQDDSFQVWEPERYRAHEARMAELVTDPAVLGALSAPRHLGAAP
ncbi:MAG: division/cell wall cluster transcriptional repressor MraZ [Pseudomonadota bacterium]